MKRKKTRQGGGTFVGLIFGLLVGLALAMIVAAYVSKVPVPLMDRGVSATVDRSAEEERNRNWDPNASLRSTPEVELPELLEDKGPEIESGARGDSAVVDGGTDVLNLPPLDEREQEAERRQASKASESRRPQQSKPSADPLGDMLASRNSAKSSGSSVAGGSAPAFIYYVQAGAYREQNQAEAQRARLSLMGVQTRVVPGESSGQKVFRVRAGPFDQLAQADQVSSRLSSNQVEGAIVRVRR